MATTSHTPVIEVLRHLIVRAGEFRPTRANVQMWITPVRAQLAKIYGESAPELDRFPLISAQLPESEAAAELAKRVQQVGEIILRLETTLPEHGGRIFIGHGRSPLWRELKDFIADRLKLPWEEFNRESVAGIATTKRLQIMLAETGFAFLVMTAEEERSDATLHARPNVIHEAGLFQGRLGFERAIVMVEEGCAQFSNIAGLSYIGFPRGNIGASFEDVRRVLEREGFTGS